MQDPTAKITETEDNIEKINIKTVARQENTLFTLLNIVLDVATKNSGL